MDVSSSAWAAVDCGVGDTVGLFGHLLHNATVCVDGEAPTE